MLSLFEQMAGTRGPALLQEHLRVQTKRSNKKKEEPLTRPSPPKRVEAFQCLLVVSKAIALLSLYLRSSWRPCLWQAWHPKIRGNTYLPHWIGPLRGLTGPIARTTFFPVAKEKWNDPNSRHFGYPWTAWLVGFAQWGCSSSLRRCTHVQHWFFSTSEYVQTS